MSGDHEGASAEGDRYFKRVGRKPVTEPCRSRDTAKTAQHQEQNEKAAVFAKAGNESNGTEQSHEESKATVDAFLRGQEVCEDRGEREQHGREQAVNDTEG